MFKSLDGKGQLAKKHFNTTQDKHLLNFGSHKTGYGQSKTCILANDRN